MVWTAGIDIVPQGILKGVVYMYITLQHVEDVKSVLL